MVTFDFAAGKKKISFYYLIGFGIFVLIMRSVLTYLNDRQQERIVYRVIRKYKEKIMDHYIEVESKKTPSEMLNILSNNVHQIEQMYLRPMLSLVRYSIFFVGSSVAIFSINRWIFLVILATSWIPVVIPRIFHKRTKKLRQESLKENEYYIAKTKEITSGYETIKSFHIEDRMIKLAKERNDANERKRLRANLFQIFNNNFSDVSSLGAFIFTQLLSIYMAWQKIITLGDVIAIIQLSNYVSIPYVEIPKCFISMKSVEEERLALDKFLLEKLDDPGKEHFQLQKQIMIQDVSFSYGDKQVLFHLEMILQKGKKYAVIGESGCGKSTLGKILLKRLKDFQGDITIDGVSIRKISTERFYNHVSPVTQSVFLFNDTIRNNITLYQNISEDKLQQALQMSGLISVIERLPKREETRIGEYGTSLSGGEMQRIAIARCLVKDAEWIIMDEATSALDRDTARGIEQMLLHLDQTVLVITHRMDPLILEQYDKIFVMKEGKIIEEGSYHQLSYFQSV